MHPLLVRFAAACRAAGSSILGHLSRRTGVPRHSHSNCFAFETLESRALLSAVRDLPGFLTTAIERNDDASSAVTSIGFDVEFFGHTYSQLYVNNNGNVTFDGPLEDWTPDPLAELGRAIIAPFWADIDTRNLDSGQVTFGQDTLDGRAVFGVNWLNVGYFDQHADVTNSFQLVLIDRSDIATDAFDIEFNYDRILWDTADPAENQSSEPARAGFSSGSGDIGTFYELIGSGSRNADLQIRTNRRAW